MACSTNSQNGGREMGWGYGIDGNGREVGYNMEATCDFPGCEAEIDRGMDYRCGPLGCETNSLVPGCGGFFCHAHQTIAVASEGAPAEGYCLTCGTPLVEAEDARELAALER
jgi:hypothetical protein